MPVGVFVALGVPLGVPLGVLIGLAVIPMALNKAGLISNGNWITDNTSAGRLVSGSISGDLVDGDVVKVYANGTLIGNLSGNGAVKTLSTTLSPIPPAKVQVTSANGGSDTEDVVLVP